MNRNDKMNAPNITVMLFVSMILFTPMALMSQEPEPEPLTWHCSWLPYQSAPFNSAVSWPFGSQAHDFDPSECGQQVKPPIPIPPAAEPTNPNTCYWDDSVWTCCDYENDIRDCEPEHEIPACYDDTQEFCGECTGGALFVEDGVWHFTSWVCPDNEVPDDEPDMED